MAISPTSIGLDGGDHRNKSEMSVGYATLYWRHEMAASTPIKDLYKMQVYALARWRNTPTWPPGALGPSGEVIPQKQSIDKAPSAELRPDRTDQDSLPPYPALDDILESLVEHELSVRADRRPRP